MRGAKKSDSIFSMSSFEGEKKAGCTYESAEWIERGEQGASVGTSNRGSELFSTRTFHDKKQDQIFLSFGETHKFRISSFRNGVKQSKNLCANGN